MRLLFVDFSLPYLLKDNRYPVGGAAVELNCWLHGLTAAGHHAGVLSWKGAADHVGHPVPCDLLDTYDPDRGVKVLKYFYDYIPAMWSAASSYQPDVLIQSCASVHTGIMAFIAGRLRRPFVYRVASDAETDGRLSTVAPLGYERLAFGYGLRHAAAMLCQNRRQRDNLSKRISGDLLHVIYNPFVRAGGADGATPRRERDYIAWLGVFRDMKNLPLLARVARALPGIRFRVAGMPDQNSGESVASAVAALKSLPNVEMAGYVAHNEIGEFLSGAVGLLATSDFEGFSNTFLEAFSAGTPLVLRRQIDPDGLVQKRGLGISVEDEAGLVAGVSTLWAMDEAQFGDMSARCRLYVSSHDPAAKVAELIAILEPLCGKTDSRMSGVRRPAQVR